MSSISGCGTCHFIHDTVVKAQQRPACVAIEWESTQLRWHCAGTFTSNSHTSHFNLPKATDVPASLAGAGRPVVLAGAVPTGATGPSASPRSPSSPSLTGSSGWPPSSPFPASSPDHPCCLGTLAGRSPAAPAPVPTPSRTNVSSGSRQHSQSVSRLAPAGVGVVLRFINGSCPRNNRLATDVRNAWGRS